MVVKQNYYFITLCVLNSLVQLMWLYPRYCQHHTTLLSTIPVDKLPVYEHEAVPLFRKVTFGSLSWILIVCGIWDWVTEFQSVHMWLRLEDLYRVPVGKWSLFWGDHKCSFDWIRTCWRRPILWCLLPCAGSISLFLLLNSQFIRISSLVIFNWCRNNQALQWLSAVPFKIGKGGGGGADGVRHVDWKQIQKGGGRKKS